MIFAVMISSLLGSIYSHQEGRPTLTLLMIRPQPCIPLGRCSNTGQFYNLEGRSSGYFTARLKKKEIRSFSDRNFDDADFVLRKSRPIFNRKWILSHDRV